MTENLRNPDQRVEDGARRRLVRGAFAVPALLTLYNGSAFAATSANSCLVKRNMSAITEPLNPSSDDMFFRYRLWVIKDSGGTIKSAWIKGADLAAYIRLGQAPFIASNKWQAFSIGTNTWTAGFVDAPSPYDAATQTLSQTGPWVALRVDSTGDIVGAGASGSGSAVGDSCWDSFASQTRP